MNYLRQIMHFPRLLDRLLLSIGLFISSCSTDIKKKLSKRKVL